MNVTMVECQASGGRQQSDQIPDSVFLTLASVEARNAAEVTFRRCLDADVTTWLEIPLTNAKEANMFDAYKFMACASRSLVANVSAISLSTITLHVNNV